MTQDYQQLTIAANLNFIKEETFKNTIDKVEEIQKLIYALKKSLKSEISKDLLLKN